MYIRTHLIPNNRDEWIITLFTDDDVKVQANIVKGYKEALQATKELSVNNDGCKYKVGKISYNGNKV